MGVNGPGTKAAVVAKPEDLRNHRLIVMFFDLTSMQPEDLDRCVKAARDFLTNKMQPADLVALVSLDQTLKVDQDFTSDKVALANEVGIYNGTEGQGFTPGATANTQPGGGYDGLHARRERVQRPEHGSRVVRAARDLEVAREDYGKEIAAVFLGRYFARRNREPGVVARRHQFGGACESFDLQRGHARSAGHLATWRCIDGKPRGSGAFNGAALTNNMNANFATQEVMATLSSDTGGKAFFDSNDFAPAFAQVQRDTSAYYAIGFHSTNPARDGKYRKLTIKINRPGVKIEYRPGYYAPADFKHSGREDRERELDEQLTSDLPATDVAVYLDAMYFRLDENRFFVPVSLIVPGSQIPFVKGGDKDKATLDIIGEVIDEVKRPIGNARETVKLNLDPALQARQKNIEYTTSFNLPPGKYHLKFVVRENQTGRMGSFEADITLPDMKKLPLKMSSIVLASLRQPSKKSSPLIRGGEEYVPNISHVFRQDQHLYLLYEVYGPTREKPAEGQPKGTKAGINLLSSLELIQGATKVYETPLVQAKAMNVEGRDAVAVELDVPLAGLKPGSYVCQLNVIDDAGGSFAFPRFAVLVREPVATATPTEPAASGSGSGLSGQK